MARSQAAIAESDLYEPAPAEQPWTPGLQEAARRLIRWTVERIQQQRSGS